MILPKLPATKAGAHKGARPAAVAITAPPTPRDAHNYTVRATSVSAAVLIAVVTDSKTETLVDAPGLLENDRYINPKTEVIPKVTRNVRNLAYTIFLVYAL